VVLVEFGEGTDGGAGPRSTTTLAAVLQMAV
jgi:hypothetical protein